MHQNKNDPPEDLTRIIPPVVMQTNIPTWEIRKFENGVEIRQKNLVNLGSLGRAFLFSGGAFTASYLVGRYKAQIPNANFAKFLHYGFYALGWLWAFAFPIFEFFIIFIDSWKKRRRFFYDAITGALQLPCDDTEYQANEYQRLILGYTSGYRVPPISIGNWSILGAIQLYLLVLDNNGQWKRHELGLAVNRRYAKKAAEKLQLFLRCDIISRRMSLAECYRDQKKEPES